MALWLGIVGAVVVVNDFCLSELLLAGCCVLWVNMVVVVGGGGLSDFYGTTPTATALI